jgi:serralysin
MTIDIEEEMLDQIRNDSSDGWDGTISYSIDVDTDNIFQSGAEFFDFTFDPHTVGTPGPNRDALFQLIALWDDVIDESIVYLPGAEGAEITISTADNFPANVGGSTYSTIHSSLPNDADVYLRPDPIQLGLSSWGTALHEFGHALGLEHPGNYNASDGGGTLTYEFNRKFDVDTVQFSIMSYFSPENYDSTINWTRAGNRPQTPMIYDIWVAQDYYNTDTHTRLGDTTYGFNSTAGRDVYNFNLNLFPVLTIWDAGGDHDRLDVSGFQSNQRIDLHHGSYSDVGDLRSPLPNGSPYGPLKLDPVDGSVQAIRQNVAIAFKTWIEDAVGGSGNDDITGNHLANYLDGGPGNDVLRGEDLGDTLMGSAGDDRLYGDSGLDLLDGGDNNDILWGGQGQDWLLGGAGADELHGDADADLLKGGSGGDLLDGGDWVDTASYLESPSGVTVKLATGAGSGGDAEGDTLTSVENLQGSNFDDELGGDGLSNRLDGGSGDDTLKGGGGADVLIGGDGLDTATYLFSESGSGVNVDLEFGAAIWGDAQGDTLSGIENLIGTNFSDRLAGDDGFNHLEGGSGPDILWGKGSGDVLEGGSEEDELHGDEGDDLVKGGGGADEL